MSLSDYQKKRKFGKTPEPKGIKKESAGPLTFVVQKHEASRLHYDFRLELNGVLKSWAVPKGPSMNPENKRLAIMVEDHPLDYANFEGIIPTGNYGAGDVMVWDRGVYTPIAKADRQQTQAILTEQLKKGHLTFVLLGEKLQGEFALVKTHGMEENAWLLIKAHDEYSNKKDILQQNKSALTGRSMDEIAQQAEKKKEVWSGRTKRQSSPTSEAQIGVGENTSPESNSADRHARMTILKDLPKSAMPHDVKPMLAHSADEPFDDKDWLFEMKYDGYRAIAEIESGNVKLYSRNHQSYNEKFIPIAESLKKFPGDVVLDGEIVMVDEKGKPHFQWLQDYPAEKYGELVYFVFDILYYEGRNVTSQPLSRRKEILKQALPPLPHVRYSDHIEETGIAMFQQIQKLGVEGIMAKNAESTYHQGTRTSQWLKIKTDYRQEVIIAGFTEPRGGRKYFGALIAGVYKHGELTYVGHIGGGFDGQRLQDVWEKLQPLKQKECPFDETPETNAPVTWIKPKLLAEVTFSNWTKDGQMRHPVFLGLRDDKQTKEVKEERYFAKDSSQKKESEVTIGKQKLNLTNLSKIFWPASTQRGERKEKYTKGDLINYYREIAPVILQYLKDRPESLLRYPNGIEGQSFYQKDASLLDANWIKTTKVHSESNNKFIEYLLCQDEATLVYLINLGCIDLNPWNSRVGHLDNPDYLIIDLDPEETTFASVVKVALTTRDVLEQLDIPSYFKTSGAKGAHIYIPMGAKYTYDQVRKLAELLCMQVHNKIPKLTSMKRSPEDRKGLVYLDYLQNIKGQTLACVYSVRAQPGATVSTPLLWKEVTTKLQPTQFTMKNIPQRMQKHGDVFKDVLGKGIEMEKVLKKMSKMI